MALNEEKLGWTTEFSGIWTFGITVYRPIWFPYILRGFYLLANVETFQILHESKWLATQVHIVVFFLAYLQKSVLRRQRLWRDLPCVSSVVCKCSQNARYDCFMQVGFEDMTVVKLFLIARILIACDCGCDKHLVNILTTSQALNVRRVQASSHWSNTIVRWKESQPPRPVMATSFQSVEATILWNDHLVSFSQWFLGLQRPVVEAIEKASRWRIGSRASQPAAFGQPMDFLNQKAAQKDVRKRGEAQSLVSLMPPGRAVWEHIIRRIISRVNN